MDQTTHELEQELSCATDASERLSLLHRLLSSMFPARAQETFPYIQEALELSVAVGNAEENVRSRIFLADWYYCAQDFPTTEIMLAQAEAAAAALDNPRFTIPLLMKRSGLLQAQDKLIESAQAMETAHAMCAEDQSYYTQSLAYLGFIYIGIGWYEKAFYNLFKALDILKNKPEKTPLFVECLSYIADLYGTLGDYGQVHSYCEQALALCHAMQYTIGTINILTILGALEDGQNNLEEALRYYKEALLLMQQKHSNMRAHSAQVLLDIAGIYIRLGNYEEAFEYISHAFSMIQALPLDSLYASAWHRLAIFYIETGEQEQAFESFHKALGYTEHVSPQLRCDIFHKLAELCEKAGRDSESYMYYKHYTELNEQLQGKEVQRKIAGIQMQFELRKVESEKEMLQVRANQLERETEYKKRELSMMALNLIKKHEGLLKLKTEIQREAKGLKGKGKHQKFILSLLKDIEGQLTSSDDWRFFEQQFNSAHIEFTTRLSQKFPGLTPTEIRICTFLKIHLSSKDIANLLCTSVYTVNTHRRNIRKKFQIAEETNLTSFLLGL